MTIFYKDGFYMSDVHNIPDDAVEITAELHKELINGQSQGKQIVIGYDGSPTLVDPKPSQYHNWNGSEWVISPEQQQAVILAEKSAKLAEINQKAQAFINNLAEYDKTPAFERDTWSIQRDEAFAWFADNTSPTPTLDLIALSRGVPVEALRQKAYEKALAYQQVAAIVSGQRQAYEDKLNATETLEQVQAIEPIYQLPQGA